MELAKKEELISKEFLFSRISDYDVYKYYTGDFTIGQVRKSPFRKDNNPSFSIYMKNGKLQHNDFADDRYRGDCIDLVQQLFNLDTKKATQKIAKDFGIAEGKDESARITSQYTKPFIDQKRHAFIQVSTRAWNKADAAYWGQFGITKEQLKEEQVYPLKELFLNRIRQGIDKDEIVYAYRYTEGFKIYFPNREKTKKWLSNIPLVVVENQQVIDDAQLLLIVKSKKDRLTLSNLLTGIPIISVQNESIAAYTEQFVERLKGKKVYISYDSDTAGKKASIKITQEFGYYHINVPDVYVERDKIKDWSDLYKEYGPTPIIEHFTLKGLIK